MVRDLPGEVSRDHIFEGLEYLLPESIVVAIYFLTWNLCTLGSLCLYSRALTIYWPFVFPHCLMSNILGPLHSSGSSIWPHSLHQHISPSGCYAWSSGGFWPPTPMANNVLGLPNPARFFYHDFYWLVLLIFTWVLSILPSLPQNIFPWILFISNSLGFLPASLTASSQCSL